MKTKIEISPCGYVATATLNIVFGEWLNQQDILDICKYQLVDRGQQKTIQQWNQETNSYDEVENPHYIDIENMTIEQGLQIIFDRLCKQPFAGNFASCIRTEKLREAQLQADQFAQGMQQHINSHMSFTNTTIDG